MTFQIELDSDELIAIRGNQGAVGHAVTFCSNALVLHGQVTSDLTTPTSWTGFTYTSISGSWTNVEPFMVLLMGTTNDINQATFRGRVRPDASHSQGITSGVVYCNQSSDDLTSAYFWIINSYDITNRLSAASSQDPDTALEMLDYNLTGGVLPLVLGLQTAYVGDVDPNTGQFRFSIDVSDSRQSDARASSTTTVLWSISGATYIAGSTTSKVITVDVPAGEQWGTLLLGDSLGQVRRRKFYINAHDANNPPFLDISSIRITANTNGGWTATIDAFNGLDDMLLRTFGVVWKRTSTPSTIVRRTVAFVGWVQTEQASGRGSVTSGTDGTAQINMVGVCGRLSSLESQETPTYDVASPVKNGDIATLTPQRTMLYYLDWYTTTGLLCDIDIDPFNDDLNFPIIPTTGNVALEAMNSIARQWGAILEFAPWGAICISRSVTYRSNFYRALLPTIINYTEQDIVLPNGISRDINPQPNTGKTDANGAIFIPSTRTVTDWQTRSPGHAQGESSGSNILANQILTADNNSVAGLVELKQRGADLYEESNLQDTLTVSHPDTYGFIIPSRSELYTFDLDTWIPVGRGVNHIMIAPSILWVNDEISYTVKPAGSVDVEAKYRRVPRKGDPGDDVTLQPPDSDVPALVDVGLPAFDFEPPDVSIPDEGFAISDISPSDLTPTDGIIFFNGDELILWSSTANRAFIARDFIRLTTPIVADITPPDLGSFIIKQMVADPSRVSKYGAGCYLLASDGTNSAVWYNPNINVTGASAGWTKGTEYPEIYTVIRGTGTPGTVGMCCPQTAGSPGTGTWSQTLDFTSSDWGFFRDTRAGLGYSRGVWVNGSGWETEIISGGDTRPVGTWSKRITQTYMTSMQIHYTPSSGSVGGTRLFTAYKNSTGTFGAGTFSGTTVASIALDTGGAMSFLTTLTINDDVDYMTVILDTNQTGRPPNINEYIIANGTVTNPFVGNGVIVRFSSDYGSTFGSPLSAGSSDSVAVSGFDIQKVGGVNYIGVSGSVGKSTTLGGSYSSWFTPASGDPICVVVPYFRRNTSTVNTTVSDPDVIVATTSGKVYWTDGTTGTPTDISPSGVTAFSDPNCLTVHYGGHLACYGSVSGTTHLFTSTDGGASWTDHGAISGPQFIRCRRKDQTGPANGTNIGQLFLVRGDGYYSSKWAGSGMLIRYLPASMTGLETIW